MLNDRQEQILALFLQAPEKTRLAGEFSDFAVNRSTLFRDLRQLVDAGILSLAGKKYTLHRNSEAYQRWDLERSPELRPTVKYDPSLMRGYEPNQSALLSGAHLHALRSAGVARRLVTGDAPEYKRVLDYLIIDLAHASSNLENVPISWLDTKALIEYGERPHSLTEEQIRIVSNHKAAIGHLRSHAADLAMSREHIFQIHRLLTRGLIHDERAVGDLRTIPVSIGSSAYRPMGNPHQVREEFALFCEKATAIKDPYEQAFFAMVFLPYMQAFQDGNKRTSRLTLNFPLVRHGLAPFSFSQIKKRDYEFGIIAFYERGNHSFLADYFTQAYGRSAARYASLIEHVDSGGFLSTIGEQEGST